MDKNKKVIIVGGGVSGMATGIYLQQNGYDTEIIEKNGMMGGACVGWDRKGCHIDGCIHWMTGVNPNSTYYPLWAETDAITPETDVFIQDDFSVYDFGGGRVLTVWADIDRFRKELLSFAPEDKPEILKFCKLIKRFQRIEGPVNKPVGLMSIWQLLKIGLTMAGDYYWVAKTGKIDCAEYGKRFKNKDLQHFFASYMAPGYNLMSMLYMLGHVTSKNGGVPIGGSKALADRMAAKYQSLGGKITLNTSVTKIRIENNRSKGVEIKGGGFLEADWVVAATPAEFSLKTLLGGKYALKQIDERLADEKTYPIYTFFTVNFKVNKELRGQPLGLHTEVAEPIVMDKEYTGISIRNYAYDRTMMRPEGTTVVQAGILGNDEMYYWWKARKEDKTYQQKKRELGEEVRRRIEERYPEYKGLLEVIDVVTPCTYERYLNTRHGSFQGFVHTSKGKALMEKGIIKGLNGFILSGQCLFHSGGLPTAVITGRFAAQWICHFDKKRFVCKRKENMYTRYSIENAT